MNHEHGAAQSLIKSLSEQKVKEKEKRFPGTRLKLIALAEHITNAAPQEALAHNDEASIRTVAIRTILRDLMFKQEYEEALLEQARINVGLNATNREDPLKSASERISIIRGLTKKLDQSELIEPPGFKSKR